MNKNIEELVKLSRKYGNNSDFILEGGGNTSFKDEEYLYIKASGVSLASINESGFVKMNRLLLKEIWDKSYPKEPAEREKDFLKDLKRAISNSEERCSRRPSVETLLHEIINFSFVIHTHPFLINALTCSKNGKDVIADLFSDEALWVPTVNPGYTLAKKVHEELIMYGKRYGKYPHIIFLENHGLFVGANSGQEIEEITSRIVSKIKSEIPTPLMKEIEGIRKSRVTSQEIREKALYIAPAIRMLFKEDKRGTAVCVFQQNENINKILLPSKASLKEKGKFALNITPDHIVYAGDSVLFVKESNNTDSQYEELKKAYRDFLASEKTKPKIISVENLGIFACGNSKKDAEAALKLFYDALKINRLAESFGGIKPMPKDQVQFIREWESESYRRKVLLGNGHGLGRLNEKIAIITGAAQGIGEGIARNLLKEKCNVIIADINEQKATEKATQLSATFGTGKATAITVNVTDESSVKNMVIDTVLEYGGLDILVNNAGVLRAASLEDMKIDDFDFVTRVNYYGYFLCTKHASRVMKIQHKFDADYFMDIVQINSKSGLSGSKKNFAYAGGKFGGIGLTQSFALELVDFNIKVNAICPGNYFNGPLWSDPDHGLFVQYLRAGKVPGAKSVDDVKKFYESKVPMRRGCTIKDISRALLYIIEQEYETGQAIPVTGGQIMLK